MKEPIDPYFDPVRKTDKKQKPKESNEETKKIVKTDSGADSSKSTKNDEA